MKAKHNRLVLFVCALLTTLAFVTAFDPRSGAESARAPADDCKCDDLPDLINRYHEVNAALAAIRANTTAIKIVEAEDGKQMAYSDKDYRHFYTSTINTAMDSVADKNAHRIKGRDRLDPNCGAMLDVALATSCLRPIIAEDERKADDVCADEYKGVGNPGDRLNASSDWMTSVSLTDMAQIEFIGYQIEKTDLGFKIPELLASCKYAKWTGIIHVSWTREVNVVDRLPHPGQSGDVLSGSDLTDNKYEYFGDMYIINGEPRSQGLGYLTVNKARNVSGTTSCHGSMLGPKKSSISISQTSSNSSSGSFTRGGSFNVTSIDPRTGLYTISVDLPGGYGYGSWNSDFSETGECAQKPSHEHRVIENQSLEGVHLSGRGSAKANALEISGSADCVKPPLVVNSSVGTTTDTITCSISWSLRRTIAR